MDKNIDQIFIRSNILYNLSIDNLWLDRPYNSFYYFMFVEYYRRKFIVYS